MDNPKNRKGKTLRVTNTLDGWMKRAQKKTERRNRILKQVEPVMNGQEPSNVNQAVNALPQQSQSGAKTQKARGIESEVKEVKRTQEQILSMLEKMAISQGVDPRASQNPPNPSRHPKFVPPPRQDQPGDAEAQPFEPTMQQLVYMLHDDSVQSRFMQASALLKPLKGNEGRTNVDSYFRHFESMTYGWSSNRRANLLATHLESRARLIYEALSDDLKQSYEAIKACVIQGGSNAQSLRTKAQNELLTGMRQARGENFMDFGLRVLTTVRDSMLPGTPEEIVEDVASSHLLRSLGDPVTHQILISQKGQYTYHQLLDQAVTLKESSDATYGFQARPQTRPLRVDQIRRDEYLPYQRDRPQRAANFTPMQPNTYRPPPQRQYGPPRPNKWQSPPYQPPQRYQQPGIPRRSPDDRMLPAGQTPRAPGRNATANAVEPEDPARDLIRSVLGSNVGGNSNQPYCPTVVSYASSAEEKSADRGPDLPRFWRTELVPVANHPLKGVTHLVIDLEGRKPDTPVGMPKGPRPVVRLKIHGYEVPCLTDAGAEINLVSAECVQNIVRFAKLDPDKMGFHPPVHPDCKAANDTKIQFLAALSLPVERGGEKIWIEAQVPATSLPQPLVLGTNGLLALGYDVIDTLTGELLLSGKQHSTNAPPSGEIASTVDVNVAITSEEVSVAAQSTIPIIATTTVTDGDYVFNREGDEVLVRVADGILIVPVSNDGLVPVTMSASAVVGSLSQVQEIYMSDDIISSDIAAELVQQSSECGTDSRDPWRLIQVDKIVTNSQEAELKALVEEFNDVFVTDPLETGRTTFTKHHIEVTDSRPIKHSPRPIPYALREKVAGMVQEYLEKGVIRPSTSPYSNPIVLVRKKDGSLRFCIDYRRLNAITKKDAYPVPDIDSILLTLGRPKFFASLDVKDAYWSIPLDEESIEKTAFPAPQGLFEWTVMPFGLVNGPATYQRFMERALHGLSGKNVRVYFDDILITSDSWLDHLNNLRSVFERCRSAGLKLKPIKCRLVAKEIGFLGHKLTADGLQKDEGKVRAMKEFPTPNSLKQLRSFLGLIGYYRKFIPGFSTVAKPLLELQKSLLNGSDFNWNEACQESMTALVAKVCQDVTLQFPDFAAAQTEPARALIVQTDASRTGLGAILGQLDGKGKARPIYFASRACTPTEAKYSVTELEALALKFAVQKFAPFIIGLHTIVETDHSALVQMFNSPKECGSARVNKWAMLIKSQFDIEVRYRPGKSNANADALSRAFEPASASLVVWVANANPQGLVPHAISKDDWITAQIDGEFGDIYKFIDKRSLPPEVEKAQSVIGQMASFTLVDRVLFYVNPHTAELQLVVPTEFQHTVFHERHGGACGVHYSGRKIYLALKKQYYWPNMRADCERWVRSCPICAFTREPRLNVPPLQPIVAEAPFDLVCMDILQLGLTLKGHKYLFVCVDHFSKFMIAEPLQTKTAEEVATALLNRLILVHGAPRRLHSDKGKEFVNTVVERLVALLGTEQTTTAGYNPRANGAAERVNRELVRMLRRSCVVPQEWDDRVQFTVFAYNTTPHESTGESPYFIIHGRDANFPSAVDPGLVPRMYADAHGFKEMIAVNANEVAAKVRENLEKARALYKKYYDAHKKVFTEKYHVGQRVMVYDPKVDSSPTRKLHWQYYGPFRVIEIEGSNAKVRPLDKPHAKTEWLPLDRLGPIPDECVMKYEGKDARKRMLQKPVAVQHDTNTSGEKAIQNPSGFKEFPVATASLCLAVAPSLPSATSEVLYTQTPVRSIETEEMEFLAKTYRSAHVAFLNEPLSHMFDGRDFECEMFSDVRSMGRLALNAQFADSVTEVLVTLPPADGVGYGEIIGAMLDHFARYPHVRFFVVPPPPIKNDAYESAITQLMRAFGTADHRNIVRLEHRLRTFYSVGWKAAGTSVDQFHSTADGRWTPVGRDTIYKFLDESMELHWPFRVGYKEHMREQRRRPRRTPPRDDHRPARYFDSPPRQRRRPNPPDRREIPRRVELSPPRLHERVPHRERYRERQSPPRLQASPPSTAPTTVAPTPAGPVPRPAQFTPLSPRALAAQLLDLDGIRLSDGEDDDPMTQEQR